VRVPTILILTMACAALDAQNLVKLRVDATDAPRRLFHAQMTLPVEPGPLTLLYPEWIPGEHAPSGPIANLVGLKMQGGGQALAWRRDDVNMFAFHVVIPPGVSSLDVAFDFISPPETGGYSSGSSATSQLAVISWNQVLLYPKDARADSLQFQATLRVPDSWRYGTALPIARESGNEVEFQPASLTTLVDSPVSAGAHYRTIQLGSDGGTRHYLHLAADSDRALEVPEEVVEAYRNLVGEAGALFGSRHYRSYHFLLTLSDHVAHFGLEHHESSDDRLEERALVEAASRRARASLLPHEFVHSWNGKYRRPSGMVSSGQDGAYDTPMKGDLLWVYEGLTEYLGEILTPRSGLRAAEDFRESLAATAAELDSEAGRTWRPLEDTAVAAQILYGAGSDYADYRRGVDFYPEGVLIWLEADTLIRQLSQGARSLDDFCRAFHGGPGGAPALKPFTFDDVVAALNSVQPYDWAAFLNQRLHSTGSHAPLGGIQRSGWKLTYDSVRSDYWSAGEGERKLVDLRYSAGLTVGEDGLILDVAFDGPAKKAGVAPAMRLIAVNGRQYSATLLREAVAATKSDPKPLELLVKDGEYYQTHRLDYHQGERYPHLVRDESAPDLLSKIIVPKVEP
jgi:predicted metalloprotease with PDZ domain